MNSNYNSYKNTDIESVDINTLTDIQDISVDKSLPQKDRLLSFVEQIKNPYCFKCGDMVVKISFSNNGDTLEDRIEKLLLS
ncbi:hypothetical protein LJB89_03235 [Tyzzerella sp. OttesenSCG-928-J15]|nr:hypothetical protein [Tyzzerella sp. OttesenSCG-928-J15]